MSPSFQQTFEEYVEIVDGLLSNETFSYDCRLYRIDGAYMNPRPIQQPPAAHDRGTGPPRRHHPMVEQQMPVFEAVAQEVLPELRAR